MFVALLLFRLLIIHDLHLIADATDCGEFPWSNDPRNFVAFSVALAREYTTPSTPEYTVIPMDHVLYNDGGYYNFSTQTFTAPFFGLYAFHFGAGSGEDRNVHLTLFAGTPEVAVARSIVANSDGRLSASGHVFIKMEAGHTASLRMAKTNNVIFVNNVPSTYFTGRLVRRLEA